jgi:carbon monoxide dehydrogenase subunit G
MPSTSIAFTVKSPPERVFELSHDLETLGSLVPDVTKVEVVDEENAYWHMSVKVGFMRRETKLHTTITELVPPRRAGFRGESDQLVMSGSVDLSPLPDGGTEVSCKIEASGKGPIKYIINSALQDRLSKAAAAFAENLQHVLQR